MVIHVVCRYVHMSTWNCTLCTKGHSIFYHPSLPTYLLTLNIPEVVLKETFFWMRQEWGWWWWGENYGLLVNRLRRLSPHFARVQKYWGEKKMYSECMEEVGDNDKGDKVKISWHLYFVIHRNCRMSTFLKLLSINLPTFSIHSLCNKWVISR